MAREDRGQEMEPDDPRYIPADLAERLKEERSALDPSMTDEQQARRIFQENAPAAAATIAQMAIHGSTERVRLDASKYVTERVLGPVSQETGGGDPLADLIRDMAKDAEKIANGEHK